METQIFKIDSAASKVNWMGRKVTGAHDGTIAIKDGEFVFTDGKLSGGNVQIDMTSIVILDVTDAATNAQFAGHLASDDFFSIDKFKTASLQITSAVEIEEGYAVTGDLTIKGITHPVQFKLEVKEQGDAARFSGKIVIDRTKYAIKFRSGNFFTNLGDTLIYNDFDLDVNVIANLS